MAGLSPESVAELNRHMQTPPPRPFVFGQCPRDPRERRFTTLAQQITIVHQRPINQLLILAQALAPPLLFSFR